MLCGKGLELKVCETFFTESELHRLLPKHTRVSHFKAFYRRGHNIESMDEWVVRQTNLILLLQWKVV